MGSPLHQQRPRPSKMELAALVASRFGLLRAIRLTHAAPGLLALTYHRIGESALCPVDHGLYATTTGGLAAHVQLLQRWSRVVTLDEALAMYRTGKPPREPMALLTFDDCYRDNYTVAFPLLRRLGVPGVFFVPTGLIEQRHVPWWDRLAYAVKHTSVGEVTLEYPRGMAVQGIREDRERTLRRLIRCIKENADLDVDRFVAGVETAMRCRAEDAPEVGELFASWSELREMAAGGMTLASHTHTHQMLGHLPYERQCEELARSRAVLREQAGIDTRAVAYPVGEPLHFNADTRRAMRDVGYEAGFSHYNGWNPTPADRYDIRRIRVSPPATPAMLHAAVVMPGIFA